MPGVVRLSFQQHVITPQPRNHQMGASKAAADSSVFPLIYGELRRLARGYLSRERANHTLQPTALVHEAWLRLRNDRAASEHLQGKTHGLALGAQAMRRLLIDYGRQRGRQKRGARAVHVELDTMFDAGPETELALDDLLAIDEALSKLEEVDPRAAQVVTLRFLAGLSNPEVAEHLHISLRTVEAEWTHARAWLKRYLSGAHA
jgi:RNA polymerase sigma factor (TIGR02999 family)